MLLKSGPGRFKDAILGYFKGTDSYEDQPLPEVEKALVDDAPRMGRLTIWAVIGFFVLRLLWAHVASIDEVTKGEGKAIPSSRIQKIQNLEGGIVAVKNVFSEVQVLSDEDEDIVYDGPLVILTSRITASASEIVAGAMKDYGGACTVGEDHTVGKGTVQSFVHQQKGLGAIKVTTALFFRPGGASTQHAGVAADIVLPSLFATDDLGERYTPYSLGSQKITPFLGKTEPVSRFPFRSSAATTSEPTPWAPLSAGLMSELRGRSATRVAENEEFKKISERLAKLAEEDDVVHLAELLKEREVAVKEGSVEATPEPQAQPQGLPLQ